MVLSFILCFDLSTHQYCGSCAIALAMYPKPSNDTSAHGGLGYRSWQVSTMLQSAMDLFEKSSAFWRSSFWSLLSLLEGSLAKKDAVISSIVHKFIGLSKVESYSSTFIDVKLGWLSPETFFHDFRAVKYGENLLRKNPAMVMSWSQRVKHLVRQVWVNQIFRSLMLVSIFGTIALTCVFACCVETQLISV